MVSIKGRERRFHWGLVTVKKKAISFSMAPSNTGILFITQESSGKKSPEVLGNDKSFQYLKYSPQENKFNNKEGHEICNYAMDFFLEIIYLKDFTSQ